MGGRDAAGEGWVPGGGVAGAAADVGAAGGAGRMASWTLARTSSQSGLLVEKPSLSFSKETDVIVPSLTRRASATMAGSRRFGASEFTISRPARLRAS